MLSRDCERAKRLIYVEMRNDIDWLYYVISILILSNLFCDFFQVSLAPYQETKETSFILSGLLPGNEYKFEVI